MVSKRLAGYRDIGYEMIKEVEMSKIKDKDQLILT
jgi:hypothetical protein